MLRVETEFTVAEDRGTTTTTTTLATSEGVAAECEKRTAIATSLATIESVHAAAKREQKAALLAQALDIEKRISELQPVLACSCPDDLGIAALSRRLKRVQAEIKQAVATERRRQEAEAARRREEIDAARRRQETNAKQWPETIKHAVLAECVEIGMTTEQVVASWGRPQQINETITATTRQEQWVYPGSTYLYFTNGTLTTIGRSR
jgi:hypothetical protein